MTTYEPLMGTPCWVDLTSSDLDVTQSFYTALFRWTFTDMGEDFGHYHLVSIGEDTVGGSMQYQPDFMGPDPFNAWSAYFSTPDAISAGRRAEQLGGKVGFQPMAAGNQGFNMEILDRAPLGNDERYDTLLIESKPVAGIWDIQGAQSEDEPEGWAVFFTVDDLNAALEAGKENGGAVLADPEEIQLGWTVAIQDPAGAVLKLLGKEFWVNANRKM